LIEDDKIRRTSGLLNAIGNPTRLKILIIIQETTRPLHIEAVSKALKMDYAAVYRHVKILQKNGLLEIYEVGRSRVLAVKNTESIKQLLQIANNIIQ
jgi:DNA-binding transcriptional ArsR family regulator